MKSLSISRNKWCVEINSKFKSCEQVTSQVELVFSFFLSFSFFLFNGESKQGRIAKVLMNKLTDDPSAEKTNKPITKSPIQEKYISFHLASKCLSAIRLKSRKVLLARNEHTEFQVRSNTRFKLYVGLVFRPSWHPGSWEYNPGPTIVLLCRWG